MGPWISQGLESFLQNLQLCVLFILSLKDQNNLYEWPHDKHDTWK